MYNILLTNKYGIIKYLYFNNYKIKYYSNSISILNGNAEVIRYFDDGSGVYNPNFINLYITLKNNFNRDYVIKQILL